MRRASPATVELMATPASEWATTDSALRAPSRLGRSAILTSARRPIAGDRQFLVPVERNPDRRVSGLSELDRDDRLIGERGLRAKPAADMFGDDLNLGRIELEPFGDLGFEVAHDLGRDMDNQRVAVEPGDCGMRFEACVLLDSGPERPFEQQRIASGARLVDRAAR